MVRETSFGVRGGFDRFDYDPESIQNKKLLSPVGKAANKISRIITDAEEKTVRALAATEPTDQLERVLKQIAQLIRGENERVPDITNAEKRIAQFFFEARGLISKAEKKALEAAQNLSGTESTIQEIAEGRTRAISRQESLSPPLKSQDTLTPEGVVRIGRESLAEAGGKIQGALYLLQATAEPREIPGILAALLDAISPQDTTLYKKTINRLLDANINPENEPDLKLNILKQPIPNIPKPEFKNTINEGNELNIPKQIDVVRLPGTDLSGTSVDSITGLTAGSSNPTQDLLTLPEAVLLQIGYPLDRNTVSENITPD